MRGELREQVAVSKLNSYQPKQKSNEKNNNLWNGVDHSDGDAAVNLIQGVNKMNIYYDNLLR